MRYFLLLVAFILLASCAAYNSLDTAWPWVTCLNGVQVRNADLCSVERIEASINDAR